MSLLEAFGAGLVFSLTFLLLGTALYLLLVYVGFVAFLLFLFLVVFPLLLTPAFYTVPEEE